MKRVFIVVGPECSGTKLLAEVFIKCLGCNGAVSDGTIVNGDNIMMRWSIPTGRPSRWLNFEHEVTKLKQRGYKPTIIITSRNWHPAVKSHQRQDKPYGKIRDQKEITDKMEKTYKHIFSYILKEDISYIISNYEGLISDPEIHIKGLSELLDLPFNGVNVTITNQNKKYYK